MGDATLLGELVRNLVDNAFKYTPRGGSVVLAVCGEPSRIMVDDSGRASRRPIANAFLRHSPACATRHHYPVRRSRVPVSDSPLFARVAQAHGATVGIETSPMNGARFVVVSESVRASERRKPCSLTFCPLSPRQVGACGIHRRGFYGNCNCGRNASDDR